MCAPAMAVVHSIHDLQQHFLHLRFWQPGLALHNILNQPTDLEQICVRAFRHLW